LAIWAPKVSLARGEVVAIAEEFMAGKLMDGALDRLEEVATCAGAGFTCCVIAGDELAANWPVASQ
jgi:hypothetical protein